MLKPKKTTVKPAPKQGPTVTRTMKNSSGKVTSSTRVVLAPSSINEAFGSKTKLKVMAKPKVTTAKMTMKKKMR